MTRVDPEGGLPHRRWRPMAALLFGAGALLVLLAFALRSPIPLFAALPLLLAPASALIRGPSGSIGGVLDWSSDGAGAEVHVRGTFVPRPPLRPSDIALHFFPVEPLVALAAPRFEVSDGELRFELDYRAPYPCLAILPRPSLVWEDPLGLLEIPLRVEGGALRVDRFPPEATRLGRSRLQRTSTAPGELRSRALGSAGEFFAVRLASPSDTYRQVNWWATARSGKLLANDYHLERTGDLVILLDLRPTSLGAVRDAKLLAVSRAAAMGIASGFLTQKARVGLGLFSEFLTAVPLGTGRLQHHRIQTALQRAEVATTPGPSERLAVSMRRYFPPGVTTLLLSSLADDDGLLVLPHLRRRGYPSFVLSPSPIPLLPETSSSSAGEDRLAERLVRLARRARVSEAWREASVIEWDDYWSLAPLASFLSRPSLVRRSP